MLKKVFLASKSPRRQELLKQMNIDFELLLKDVNEDFPTDLEPLKVAEYIAVKKANAFELKDQDAILITADTVVIKFVVSVSAKTNIVISLQLMVVTGRETIICAAFFRLCGLRPYNKIIGNQIT